VVQSAENGDGHDAAETLDVASNRGVLFKRQVRARPIVIGAIARKNAPQMRLTEDHDVIQALASDRADQSFQTGM